MVRKIFSINLYLSIIFLLTTVLSPSSFSYETRDLQHDWVDESLGYKVVTYKKVRCPRCGMESYYIPGKECPHSYWVHYEVTEKKEKLDSFISDSETEIGYEEAELGKRKNKEGSFDLLTQKKDRTIKEIKKYLSEEGSKAVEKKDSSSQSEGLQKGRYELRQKLVCPYDGHNFFPEGDLIEDVKLMQKTVILEGPSSIESSFAKSIPFGVPKELQQFGYDLFKVFQQRAEEKEEKSATTGEQLGSLAALGMLKNSFISETSSTGFSSQLGSQIPVIPVGPDYIIGPGDTLVINIWGSVQESFPVQIDREGKIMLPKAGPLYLWGLKFKDAESRIKERLNQFYTNFNVDVSMGKLRKMQVYIIGEVKKPGSYNIDPHVSIFQALTEAEGPTKLGSLRRIKLIHVDGKEEVVDLYPFLLQGENIKFPNIQSGDTIFVPAIGDVVAVAGNVKRPAIYETKSTILLSDLLNFAGGITPIADLQQLQVERITDNGRRIMLDIELVGSDYKKVSLENISMQNGDFVIVSPIVRLKHDFVSILGNVERPGDYALTKDMRVSELIKRAKGFLPATYLYRAEIARVTKDRTRQIVPVNLDKMTIGAGEEDILLNEWDILLVYSDAEVQPPLFVEIDGAINRPGRYELTPGMKISDLVFKAGGVKSKEVIKGAELFHIMPGEQPVVRDISIKRLSDANVSIDKDIILRGGDALFIKSEPKLTERRMISLKGEVRYPGTYFIIEGERLSTLIERAGGFTKDAFWDGAMFTRKSIKEAQESMRRRFIERENRNLLGEQQAILMRGGTGVDTSQMVRFAEMRTEMIESVAEAEMKGRMVIKLMSPSQLKGTKCDILLEDGDTLTIPPIPSAITVIGSVNSATSIPFEAGRGLEYYLRKTGGLTKHADRNGIYVLRANGEAISKFMMSKRIERGDTIVVPQEFKYWTPPGQVLRDTVDMLSRIAIGVGIIAALQ